MKMNLWSIHGLIRNAGICIDRTGQSTRIYRQAHAGFEATAPPQRLDGLRRPLQCLANLRQQPEAR